MTSSKRIIKQIIIGSIFLFILGFLLGGIYFFLPKENLPSCYDNIKNQEEEDIDCGGPCEPCKKQAQEEMEILTVQIFLVKGNTYSAVSHIRNDNHEYGASSVSYAFEFYDFRGNIISSREGTTYIFPQETKYVIEDTMIPPSEPDRVKFNIKEIAWVKLKDFQEPEFKIYSAKYERLPLGEADFSEYSAILKNNSDFDFQMIKVNLILRDAQGQIVGVGKTEMDGLRSQEERFFSVTWPRPPRAEVEDVDVEVETNLFLQEDFIKQYSP